ncbi:NAD(P)-binding domain superfamily protein [Pleurotus pulmonarius]
MKVFVLGATGFIGFPVAQALARAGHIVYGLTRSEANGNKLAAEEVIPIIAEPTSTSWHHLIAKLHESIGGFPDLATASNTILTAVAQSAANLRPPGAPKLSYIYTSALGCKATAAPASSPTPRLSVTRAPDVLAHSPRTGRRNQNRAQRHRHTPLPPEGKVAWYLAPGGRFALVHADDLADLYVRAAEKAQIIGGNIFDASNEFTESTAPEFIKPFNLFEEALGNAVTQAILGEGVAWVDAEEAGSGRRPEDILCKLESVAVKTVYTPLAGDPVRCCGG